MKTKEINNLKLSIMGGLPASEKKYSVNEFKNNTPEWFIFGWPYALENLMNKIN